MDADAPNPVLQSAIPHGTVVLDLLARVVSLGSLPGVIGRSLEGDSRLPLGVFPLGVWGHSESFFQGLNPNRN